jgi:hypothetical protein
VSSHGAAHWQDPAAPVFALHRARATSSTQTVVFFMVASADNAKIASKDPSSKMTFQEEDGLIVESIAY